MTVLAVNVTLDVKPYLDVKRFAQKNQSRMNRTAAEQYLQFLRTRYIVNASGGGEWPDLADETIKRKERRAREGKSNSANIEQILRETDTVLESLGIKTRGKLVYVGFVREKDHPRGPSVNQLVIVHSEGLGTAPIRKIIVLPDNTTRKQMVDNVRKEYNRGIRQSRQR